MIEQAEDPAMAARLENRESGVVLPQHQDAIEREAEGPAEHDAVRPAVRDHQHSLPRVAGDDRLEGRPHARLHIRQPLAFGKLEATDAAGSSRAEAMAAPQAGASPTCTMSKPRTKKNAAKEKRPKSRPLSTCTAGPGPCSSWAKTVRMEA